MFYGGGHSDVRFKDLTQQIPSSRESIRTQNRRVQDFMGMPQRVITGEIQRAVQIAQACSVIAGGFPDLSNFLSSLSHRVDIFS